MKAGSPASGRQARKRRRLLKKAGNLSETDLVWLLRRQRGEGGAGEGGHAGDNGHGQDRAGGDRDGGGQGDRDRDRDGAAAGSGQEDV